MAVWCVWLWSMTALGSAQLEGFATTLAFRVAEATLPLSTLEPAATPLQMEPGRREGGAALLVRAGERRLLLLADEDALALRVVSPDDLSQLALVPLRGRPGQLVVAGDGRVYVTLRDRAQVWALEWTGGEQGAALQRVATISTAAEPVALAVTPDGDTLLVASGWGRRLAAYAMRTHAERFSLKTPPEPRAVTTSADGRWALMSHALGDHLSRVRLPPAAPQLTRLALGGADGVVAGDRIAAGGDVRQAAQGFALVASSTTVMAPLVLVHTGLLPRGPYGTSTVFPAHETSVAQLDGDTGALHLRVAARRFVARQGRPPVPARPDRGACLLPRAAAFDARRSLLLVACWGQRGQVLAYAEGGEGLRKSTVARWQVPARPTGLAVDAEGGRAFVWTPHEATVSELKLDGVSAAAAGAAGAGAGERGLKPQRRRYVPPHTPDELPTSGAMLSPAAKRGRLLFHAAGDKRLARDGRACASCHPDGRADGITWPTPDGRLQTPMLAGRLKGNAPYGWRGASATVPDHLKHTFARLGGSGLSGADLQDLVAYLHELPAPPATRDAPTRPALVQRGRALFHSDGVGCASCHQEGDGSDGASHNVGSGRALDTPSLRFIAGSGPYFHDGRYASLIQMLRATKGQMGWDAELSEPDLRAIEAYLLTL